jgi:hypothetical protein
VGFQDEHVQGEEAVKTHRLTQKRGRRPWNDAAILAKLDKIPLRSLWPFTRPEQSASSRIEYLLDRLPILFEAQRNLSNERMLLEAPVSQAGASHCNGVM